VIGAAEVLCSHLRDLRHRLAEIDACDLCFDAPAVVNAESAEQALE
jgi:hypothetical protein